MDNIQLLLDFEELKEYAASVDFDVNIDIKENRRGSMCPPLMPPFQDPFHRIGVEFEFTDHRGEEKVDRRSFKSVGAARGFISGLQTMMDLHSKYPPQDGGDFDFMAQFRLLRMKRQESEELSHRERIRSGCSEPQDLDNLDISKCIRNKEVDKPHEVFFAGLEKGFVVPNSGGSYRFDSKAIGYKTLDLLCFKRRDEDTLLYFFKQKIPSMTQLNKVFTFLERDSRFLFTRPSRKDFMELAQDCMDDGSYTGGYPVLDVVDSGHSKESGPLVMELRGKPLPISDRELQEFVEQVKGPKLLDGCGEYVVEIKGEEVTLSEDEFADFKKQVAWLDGISNFGEVKSGHTPGIMEVK